MKRDYRLQVTGLRLNSETVTEEVFSKVKVVITHPVYTSQNVVVKMLLMQINISSKLNVNHKNKNAIYPLSVLYYCMHTTDTFYIQLGG